MNQWDEKAAVARVRANLERELRSGRSLDEMLAAQQLAIRMITEVGGNDLSLQIYRLSLAAEEMLLDWIDERDRGDKPNS